MLPFIIVARVETEVVAVTDSICDTMVETSPPGGLVLWGRYQA